MVFVPAAFNGTTGPAHWELLLRARAWIVRYMLWDVLQQGTKVQAYHSWGHSMSDGSVGASGRAIG